MADSKAESKSSRKKAKKGAAKTAKQENLSMSQRFWRELRGYAEALLIAYFIVTFLFTTVGVVGSSMRPNLDGGSGSLPQALWQGDRVFIPKLDTWLRRANILPNYPRGEIVVVREPKNAPSYFVRKQRGCTTFLWMDQCRPFFIKRLIALPGDSVKIERGKVFVNGYEMDQSYIDGTGEIIPEPIDFPRIIVENDAITGFQGLAQGTYSNSATGPQPVSIDEQWVQTFYANTIENLAPLPADAPQNEAFVHEVIVPEGHYFIMGDNRTRHGSEDSRYFGPIPIMAVAGKANAILLPPMRDGKMNWGMRKPPEAFSTIPNPPNPK